MRILLVTSEINYCPGNYDLVLKDILDNSGENIKGIIIVKSNVLQVLGKLISLKLLRCNNIYKVLKNNLICARKKKKEALFTEKNIPVFYTKNINSSQSKEWIKNMNCDLLLNLRTRCIFKEKLLSLPRLGCLNVHHGLLPAQRGLFCNLFAISNGMESGFTIHKMTNRVDQGAIYCRKRVESNTDYMQYLESLAQIESTTIVDFIHEISVKEELPKEFFFECRHPVVTTTPSIKQIREFQRKGVIL